MGPQHPSTHGVLRLILELDGETVTEARVRHRLPAHRHREEPRVPLVDPGRHVRDAHGLPLAVLQRDRLLPRRWRSCSASPTQIPERATVIRVMMMELNRISSHLVALATGGMELGALTAMIFGFRERETVLDIFELVTGLRMNHAYIRPGGVAQDLPAGRGQKIADAVDAAAQELQGHRRPARRQRHLDGAHRGRRLPRPHRLHGARHHRPDACARPACRATCASRSRTAATRPTSSTSSPQTTSDAYGRFLIRLAEMERVAEDRRAVPRPAAARPGHGRGQEDRLARAARASAPTAWATPSTTSGTSWASRWRR